MKSLHSNAIRCDKNKVGDIVDEVQTRGVLPQTWSEPMQSHGRRHIPDIITTVQHERG